MKKAKNSTERRIARQRRQLSKRENGRPRLSVFRSSKNIHAQIIDDVQGCTLASASSLEKDVRKELKTGADREAAATIGKLVAKRCLDAGIEQVVFDRGGYRFHGRVKALADAARETGLNF